MTRVDSGSPPPGEVDSLRAERDEWRRRAELAEAVGAERLARAETAERALAAAEAVLATSRLPPTASPKQAAAPAPAPAPEPRPKSLRERWRRYTDTIN
jgi:hypothetical protein